MKTKILGNLVAALAIGSFGIMPMTASAQSHRQHERNQWRDISLASGAVGLLGLLKGDNTLFFAGAAGALYSQYRLGQDRNSHNKRDRARAYYFSRTSFDRDGHHYVRHTVKQHGQTYYRFVRSH